MVQTREQVRACLVKKRDGSDADSSLDMQRQQIEANQTNTLKLCTEKVLLAQQAYDLVNSSAFHILRPFLVPFSNSLLFSVRCLSCSEQILGACSCTGCF